MNTLWRLAWMVQQMLNKYEDPLRMLWFKLYSYMATARLRKITSTTTFGW